MQAREKMEMDVCIVGAGPAGLAAAIRLRQLALGANADLSVCIVEKGSEPGAHILSGAVLEPKALDELLPEWRTQGAPITVPVTKDRFRLLLPRGSLPLPTPPQMRNHGNYVVSLSDVCRWLAAQAEGLGVQIFSGFPAADIVVERNRVMGVVTGDFGIAKDGVTKASYQPGVFIAAKVTLFAEGCRGSLSERLMRLFGLRAQADPQTYALGLKELWEIDPALHRPGEVLHTVGWPLGAKTYGGSFLYHGDNHRVALGLVAGLDYADPLFDPYAAFQRLKTHSAIAPLFKGARRIGYGARALNEGGLQSLPALSFPGGLLLGCAAGFLNVPKIKGSHLAMKSGMLAAEAAFRHLTTDTPLSAYETSVRESWIYDELYCARNIRPGFRHGLGSGLANAALDTYLFRGRAPWTLHNRTPDHRTLVPAAEAKTPEPFCPDGVLTFDRLSSVYLSNTNHEEDQPSHLWLKDPTLPVCYTLPVYAEPAQRYCPAGVYEIVEEAGAPIFRVNAQNCVHCKTCDIKEPSQNVVWTTPEGGGGPNYSGM